MKRIFQTNKIIYTCKNFLRCKLSFIRVFVSQNFIVAYITLREDTHRTNESYWFCLDIFDVLVISMSNRVLRKNISVLTQQELFSKAKT